jgi:hypothetical protein
LRRSFGSLSYISQARSQASGVIYRIGEMLRGDFGVLRKPEHKTLIERVNL